MERTGHEAHCVFSHRYGPPFTTTLASENSKVLATAQQTEPRSGVGIFGISPAAPPPAGNQAQTRDDQEQRFPSAAWDALPGEDEGRDDGHGKARVREQPASDLHVPGDLVAVGACELPGYGEGDGQQKDVGRPAVDQARSPGQQLPEAGGQQETRSYETYPDRKAKEPPALEGPVPRNDRNSLLRVSHRKLKTACDRPCQID